MALNQSPSDGSTRDPWRGASVRVVRPDNDPEVPARWRTLTGPRARNGDEALTDESDDEAALLRATSDELVLAIREVTAREVLKRGTKPADPSFAQLARDVRIAAEVVLQLAQSEESTARAIFTEPGVAKLPPIETVAPGRELASILERWRAIEQQLEAADPGSAEARELMVEFERMRRQYADALEAKRARAAEDA